MLKKGHSILVHRAVAKAFIPNPQGKPCVNHKDGNKLNNHVSNLEWVTYSENERHSYDVLGKKPNKTNLGNKGILSASSKPIARYVNGNIIGVYAGASEAAEKLKGIGYPKASQGRISTNVRGESNTCYNSVFKLISKRKYNLLCKQVKTN